MIQSVDIIERELIVFFELFGSPRPHKDFYQLDKGDNGDTHLAILKRDILLINFERFILSSKLPSANEEMEAARERLRKANDYFNAAENEVSLFKICSFILKIQKELNSLLNTKDENYDEQFKWLNQLIRFCKTEVSSTEIHHTT